MTHWTRPAFGRGGKRLPEGPAGHWHPRILQTSPPEQARAGENLLARRLAHGRPSPNVSYILGI